MHNYIVLILETTRLSCSKSLSSLKPIPNQEPFKPSLSAKGCCYRNLFVFLTIFFSQSHLYSFISFCFYIPISLRYLALHRYKTTSLFISYAFTPTKDYSPKRKFNPFSASQLSTTNFSLYKYMTFGDEKMRIDQTKPTTED